MSESNEKHLSYIEHINELKWLVIRSFMAFLVPFIFYLSFHQQVALFIRSALDGVRLIYLSPMEYMMAILSLSFILALVTIIPYIILEIYFFVRPALTRYEHMASIVLAFIAILALGGVLYIIYTYIPQVVRFLLNTQAAYARPVLSFNAVVDFIWIVGLLLFFNILIPFAIIALARILEVPRSGWKSLRPFVIIGSFLLGGLITTDDNVFVQAGFALWVFLLYNIGVVFAKENIKNENI